MSIALRTIYCWQARACILGPGKLNQIIETIIKHVVSTIPATEECFCMDDVYYYFCDGQVLSKADAFISALSLTACLNLREGQLWNETKSFSQ